MTEPLLILGDCLEVMAGMEPDSVDAVVTDPPYSLSFMSKAWDETLPGVDVWEQALNVLKPAHYLMAFGGTRTHHRLMCALEDAGFEIRDTLMWLYGSGFPKGKGNLKPAWEPIILCRKPGAKVRPLGIDECRIEGAPDCPGSTPPSSVAGRRGSMAGSMERVDYSQPSGRWPANLILDETSGAMLDEQTGMLTSGVPGVRRKPHETNAMAGRLGLLGEQEVGYADSGGASRFFYCAKASRAERNAGCEGLEAKVKDAEYRQPIGNPLADRIHGCGAKATNHHPTVKPVALMSWLVRLIALPGATVLDPFMGSGTTGVACAQEGREFIGIEREPEYLEIAKARIDNATRQGVLL